MQADGPHGGGFALLSASQFDFQVASVNDGEVPDDAAGQLAGACPIVASYGKRDPTLRGRAERLETALASLDMAHDVKEHPAAGHSMNRISTGSFGPLVRFVGMNDEPAATEDAWTRIDQFFEQHLRKQCDARRLIPVTRRM